MTSETTTQSSGELLTASQRLALSEQRHRILAQNARDVVWSMSPSGQITYISNAIEKLRGLTPEEAMAQSLDEIVTPDSQAQVLAYFNDLHEAQSRGQPLPSFRGDLEYYRKDGSTFWTEVLAFALVDDQGQLVEVLGVTRDIDERKQHQAYLEQARLSAEQANRAKTRFLAHISHEMRTPLTTLMSWLDLALEKTKLPDEQALLMKSKKAGDLLLGIINDLLDLSRLEQGQLTLRHQPFEVAEVLAQVRDFSLSLIGDRPVVFESAIDPLVPRRLIGDRTRVAQAVLNLSANAAKFTQAGHIKVHVDLVTPIVDKRAHLRFSITDTGPGIDPRWHQHLFEDLFQVPQISQIPASGAGLGLPITKRLSRMMGGDVGVKSEPGKGSTFWFSAVIEMDLRHPSATATQDRPTVAHLAGKRVLLVEDYDSLRQAMARTLTNIGLQVDQAHNGAEALELAQTQPYDLVLMDLSMPVMDGKTCTRQMRATPSLQHLPIIGLTAAGFEEDREELMAIGMTDYLLKPFQLDDLVKAMTASLTVSAGNVRCDQ